MADQNQIPSPLGGPAPKKPTPQAAPPKPARDPMTPSEKKTLKLVIGGIVAAGIIGGGIIALTAPKSEPTIAEQNSNYISPIEAADAAAGKPEGGVPTPPPAPVNQFLETGTTQASEQENFAKLALPLLSFSTGITNITDRVGTDINQAMPGVFAFQESATSAQDFTDSLIAALPDGWSVLDHSCASVEGKQSALTPQYGVSTVFLNTAKAQSCPVVLQDADGTQIIIWAYSNDNNHKLLDENATSFAGIQDPGYVPLTLPPKGVLVAVSPLQEVPDNFGAQGNGATPGLAPTATAAPSAAATPEPAPSAS